jgi:beta-phosphoglucomutase
MPEFEAIFFDFDGVLADTEPVHWACWSEVLHTLGVNLEWDFYREQCIGIDDREMLRMMAATSDPPRAWESLWELYPSKRELFRGRMAATPPFLAETSELIQSLHRDYALAVVSSSSTDEIEPMLEAGGLRQHFRTVVGGNQVKVQKPAPEPYLTAAERLGVRRAIVLEDSAAGMASGRAAGFEVLAITHPAHVPRQLRDRLARGTL